MEILLTHLESIPTIGTTNEGCPMYDTLDISFSSGLIIQLQIADHMYGTVTP